MFESCAYNSFTIEGDGIETRKRVKKGKKKKKAPAIATMYIAYHSNPSPPTTVSPKHEKKGQMLKLVWSAFLRIICGDRPSVMVVCDEKYLGNIPFLPT